MLSTHNTGGSRAANEVVIVPGEGSYLGLLLVESVY